MPAMHAVEIADDDERAHASPLTWIESRMSRAGVLDVTRRGCYSARSFPLKGAARCSRG